MPDTDLLSTSQVRDLTGWSTSSIQRWATQGVLPHAVKLPGETGAYLFSRADVEAFAASRSTPLAS